MDKLSRNTPWRFGTLRYASYKVGGGILGARLDRVRDYFGSSPKRFFLIVSPPILTGTTGTSARRLLLFDNHPESLRLVSELEDQFQVEESFSNPWEKCRWIFCALVLIVVLLAAMLIPLWA